MLAMLGFGLQLTPIRSLFPAGMSATAAATQQWSSLTT
jgi:hypothetical protein